MTKKTVERLFDERAKTQEEVMSSMSAALRAVRAIDNASTLTELEDAVQAALGLVEELALCKYQNTLAERAFIKARDAN
jgi:hypothetical protein